MKGIFNEAYDMMDSHFEASPENPISSRWVNRLYVEMERELPYPETEDKKVWATWKETLRKRLKEVMYIESWGDMNRIPEYTILEEVKCENYSRQKICFESVPGLYAIAYLLIPDGIKGKVPGMLCPCGHDPNGVRGLIDPELAKKALGEENKAYAHELAKLGFVSLTLENVGWGCRSDESLPETERFPGTQVHSCELMYRRLNHIGRDLTGLRIYELTLCLNLLCSLPMVDEKRIGCVGLSGGCWLSQLMTGLDDRIQAVILSGYFTTFAQTAWNGHCLCHHPHRIGNLCDMTDLSALIAPRPQFVESGKQDAPYRPEPAYSIVKRAYRYWNAEDKLGIHEYEGKHLFHGGRSLPWIVDIMESLAK